ncbi:MAG: ABC transporter permease [Pseudomonadota bacterium]
MQRRFQLLLIGPALVFALAFFAVPMVRLAFVGASGPDGLATYLSVLTTPRHREVMIATLLLAATVTLTTLVLATIAALFLARARFPGRAVLVSMLTFPLAFPGVVVGFMVILLAGRQGLINEVSTTLTGERIVFAYSMGGLFLGYLYFSIPRVLLTVMAGVETLDPAVAEAARSLGAKPLEVLRDVTLPALTPALIASGAIAFATAMGAFGTAFTLATDIDVLPMLIYTEFTLQANFAAAGALSIMLGVVTWAVLFVARMFGGNSVAAAG